MRSFPGESAAIRIGLAILCGVSGYSSSYAGQELRVAPGQVICRDRQLALQYLSRHADLAPDPAFKCWPVAPLASVFELQVVNPNVSGRRMIAVQVVQPNFPPFTGYAFLKSAPPLVPKQASAGVAPEQFEGLWAATKEDCTDQDSPWRTLIDLKNVVDGKPVPLFDQYEHHCKIERRSIVGNSMTLDATCFEAWEYFTKGTDGQKETIKLSIGNGDLIIDSKAYQRCAKEEVRTASSRGQQAANGETDPSAFVVTLSATVASVNPPTITVRTNLPDGANFSVGISGQMPACLPHCDFGFPSANVKNGTFTVLGPRPLEPNVYTIEIIGYPNGSEDPNDILGKMGKHLVGPYVFTGVAPNYVPVSISEGSPSDKMFGRIVRDVLKIQVLRTGEFRYLQQ